MASAKGPSSFDGLKGLGIWKGVPMRSLLLSAALLATLWLGPLAPTVHAQSTGYPSTPYGYGGTPDGSGLGAYGTSSASYGYGTPYGAGPSPYGYAGYSGGHGYGGAPAPRGGDGGGGDAAGRRPP